MSWCWCKTATLYLDGAVRCDLTMRLATRECEEHEEGSPKLFKPGKMVKPKIQRHHPVQIRQRVLTIKLLFPPRPTTKPNSVQPIT